MTASLPPTVSEAESETADSVQTAYDKAVNLFASGQTEAADALLAQVLKQEPTRHGALHLRGVIAAMRGDPGRGVELIEAALALHKDNAGYWGNLGTALKQLGWMHEAAEAFGRAMELDPKKSDFATGLGLVMEALGRSEEAVAAHRLALQKNPNLSPAAFNLGRFLAEQGQPDEGVELLRQAIEINPRYTRAYSELARIFLGQDDEEAALATLRAALDVDPTAADPIAGLSRLYGRKGRFDEVALLLQRALQAAPERADLHGAQGRLHLRLGRFAEGWAEHAWRWKSAQGQKLLRRYELPYWDGTALAERRLLVWAEPGLAEQILWTTVLPDLTWQGGTVTVACDPRLIPLLERNFERLDFEPQDSLAAVEARFDCQVALGDLPRLYRGAESRFPKRRASLLPDPDRVAQIGAAAMRKAKGRFLVALARGECDAGDESPPLEALLPLLEVPGCRVVALQSGPLAPALAAQGLESPGGAPIDWDDDLETPAAVMAAYDLVVALDETAAHLAGALGIQALVLLPRLPGWCWMRERADSPWYPSLRLFRRGAEEDWDLAVARLAAALAGAAGGGAA